MSAVDFTDHASSPIAYDTTGLQNMQRRLIQSAINTLPSAHLRHFATLIYQGETPASAARLMGQPAVVGASWWLDVQPALKDKLRRSGARF